MVFPLFSSNHLKFSSQFLLNSLEIFPKFHQNTSRTSTNSFQKSQKFSLRFMQYFPPSYFEIYQKIAKNHNIFKNSSNFFKIKNNFFIILPVFFQKFTNITQRILEMSLKLHRFSSNFLKFYTKFLPKYNLLRKLFPISRFSKKT